MRGKSALFECSSMELAPGFVLCRYSLLGYSHSGEYLLGRLQDAFRLRSEAERSPAGSQCSCARKLVQSRLRLRRAGPLTRTPELQTSASLRRTRFSEML